MPIQEIPTVEDQIGATAQAFESTMRQLFDEDPGLFQTTHSGETLVHSTKATWDAQVSAAGEEFQEELKKLVEQFEVRLHNGEFA